MKDLLSHRSASLSPSGEQSLARRRDRDLPRRLARQIRQPQTRLAAGNDRPEGLEIHVAVPREAVTADAAPHLDADRGELSIAHPDARMARPPFGRNAEGAARLVEHHLEIRDEAPDTS